MEGQVDMKTITKIITGVIVAEITVMGAIAAATMSPAQADTTPEYGAEGTIIITDNGPILRNTRSADHDEMDNIRATMEIAEQYITTDEDGTAYFELDGQRWPVATYENGKHQLPVLG